MRILPAVAALLGAAMLVAGRASAEEEEARARFAPGGERPFHFADRPLTLDGVIGFGTPVGLLGGVVQYDLVDALSVGVGAGANIGGPELAALLRVRPFVWEHERAMAIELGGAFSGSHYVGQVGDLAMLAGEGGGTRPDAQLYHLDVSYWAQIDVGFEMKTRSGFHLVVAQGVAIPLNADAGTCTSVASGAPVICNRQSIENGERPQAVPLVLTAMIGWSL